MPLRPIYIPDGFHRGSVTFRTSWEYFDEPYEPPPPPDYTPSGPFSTPLEWWDAQAEFYGCQVSLFPG